MPNSNIYININQNNKYIFDLSLKKSQISFFYLFVFWNVFPFLMLIKSARIFANKALDFPNHSRFLRYIYIILQYYAIYVFDFCTPTKYETFFECLHVCFCPFQKKEHWKTPIRVEPICQVFVLTSIFWKINLFYKYSTTTY